MTVTTLESLPSLAAPRPLPSPTRTEQVVRADDQLRLTIELINLDVDPTTNRLIRVDAGEPFTGVRLVFGSQHTVEATISTADPTPSAEGVDHRTARDSRIVYALPEGTPYALGALLDLATRALNLDDRAIPGDPKDKPWTSSRAPTSPPSRWSTRWSSRPTRMAGSPPRPRRSPAMA